jgi:hypothetical protein
MGGMVMGQELCAAVGELTRDSPYTTRSELYRRYFRRADWDNFVEALWYLNVEGVVTCRRHPQVGDDRLVALTDEGRSAPVSKSAIERGRQRRHESPEGQGS